MLNIRYYFSNVDSSDIIDINIYTNIKFKLRDNTELEDYPYKYDRQQNMEMYN